MLRQYRVLLLLIGLSALAILPNLVFGAIITPGQGWSIIPKECNCNGQVMQGGITTTGYAAWGCVIKTLANIVNLAAYLGIFIAVLIIAYAGFLWVLNPISPENRSQARQILINAAIGLVLTLGAWLLVNTLITLLGAQLNGQTGVAGLTSPLAGGGDCGSITDKGNQATQQQQQNPPTGPQNPLGPGDGSCDASQLQGADGTGQYGLSQSQATVLACLAGYESTCGQKFYNYNWGKGSSAAGDFQITLQQHGGPGGCLNNAACQQAAGVSQLRCDLGFKGGNPLNNQYTDQCIKAARDFSCEVQAAACIVHTEGYGAWLADPNHGRQQQCISGG
jgi:hypothetical protein